MVSAPDHVLNIKVSNSARPADCEQLDGGWLSRASLVGFGALFYHVRAA